MGVVAICTPDRAIADALDCLCVPFASYAGTVSVVFFNGHTEPVEVAVEGDCENSPCGPAEHFNNCDYYDDYYAT